MSEREKGPMMKTIEKILSDLEEQRLRAEHDLVMPGEDVLDLGRAATAITEARAQLHRPASADGGAQ